MSELNLAACPICRSRDSLYPQKIDRGGQSFLWYECRECGSVLLSVGDDQWAYQKIGREDKAHLLKQPVTQSELGGSLPQTDAEGMPSKGVKVKPSIKCPECNTLNPLSSGYCGKCGGSLESARIAQEVMPQPEGAAHELQEEEAEAEVSTEEASPAPVNEAVQHLERAFALEDDDEYEKALEECHVAIRLDPTLADAHNFRGVILEEMGRSGDAVLAYREAVRLDPGFDAAEENLEAVEADLRELKEPSVPTSGEQTLVRQDERRLWLKWVLANAAALVVAGVVGAVIMGLALGIAEPEEIAGTASSDTVIVGLYAFLLGTMQWLVLRQRSFRYLAWVGATVGGAVLYPVLVSVGWNPAWSQSPDIWERMAVGALSVAAMGTAQWLLLRRRFSGAGWWILAIVAGAALASIVDQTNPCLALLALFPTWAFTGIVLVRLFRQPSEMVEMLPSSQEQIPEPEEYVEAPDEVATLTGSQRFFKWFETARVAVVVGGTATGAIVGGLTTALPVAVLILLDESGRCFPLQASARVSMVLQWGIPGVIVGALWGTVAGLTTRWMANRMGGRAGLGLLGLLLLLSLLVAVVVAPVWFVWVGLSCP